MVEPTLPVDFPMSGSELETLGPSSLTLAGLVKHMAFVEDDTFTRTLLVVRFHLSGTALRAMSSSGLGDPRPTIRLRS